MPDMIEHACECCGRVRLVRRDKVAQGKQRLCRHCQGPAAAKRHKLYQRTQIQSPPTFSICKECGNDYQTAAGVDDGYCCETCRKKAQAGGGGRSALTHRLLAQSWRVPVVQKIENKESQQEREQLQCIKNATWEQLDLLM